MIDDVYASMPISSCGTLNISGETYILTNDLTSSGTCFTITASGITLDGNGHTLTGPGSQFGVNVREYATGVTVKNMDISDFNTGIYVTASDTQIINNIITDMSWSGITASNSCGVTISENTVRSSAVGIEAKYSTGIMIDQNNVDGNSQNGIRITNVDGVVITGNSAITQGSRGIILQSSDDGYLVDNISSGNEAILLHNSHNNILVNNSIESCSDCNSVYNIGVTGIMIWDSNGNSLIKNNIDSTHLWGINLLNSNENMISGNLISGHQKEIASNAVGIQLGNSHYNVFNYNTISDNERPYSISASSNNQIYNNNFISNLNSGLLYEDSENNVFNLDLPVGGNYWDNFDEVSEGCEDIDNDFVCDSAFVDTDSPYLDTIDAFAWSTPDDWLVNSPEILNIDLLDIPEAAFCPGAEPDVPICEEPEVLDPETNTCIVPTPDVPICEEPEVLDPETNTCAVPQPDDLPVDATLICHIPPGNPDNAHTLMISSNAYPAHLAHGDYLGACTESNIENVEFEVPTDNETLNGALELLQILSENLDDDSNVGNSISKAADLHKLFAHEDKSTKKLFQSAFAQFSEDVKEYYGDDLGFAEKFIIRDLDKAALKLQNQIDKDEIEDELKNKIQLAKQYLNAKEELKKIQQEIVFEKTLKSKEDKEKIDALKLQELHLLKKTLFVNEKYDGEKSSPQLLKSIKEKADEKVKDDKKNQGKNDSNGNSKDNKGKGNSKGNDNGNKGKSGNDKKGNSGKSNNGKSKDK